MSISDVDFFRLDLAQSAHAIIEALNRNFQDLDASLLDANGNELSENIYSIRGLHGHVHGDGFQIRDHLSPGTYYLKVPPAGRPEPRPSALRDSRGGVYRIHRIVKECSEETQALNSPSISDPLYACQWHLESIEFVDSTESSDNYVHDFGGTSAAAPIISVVAALLRSATPDLPWRDLKLILAASAQKNDPDNAGWEEGTREYRSRYHFNHEYGFALVDAGAAVELAKEWVNVSDLEIHGVSAGQPNAAISDASLDGAPTTISSSITLKNGIGFVEFVEVDITFRH